MKRGRIEKLDTFVSLTRQRSIQILIGVGLLYILLVTVEIPFVFKTGFSSVSQEFLTRPSRLESEEDLEEREAPTRPLERVSLNAAQPIPSRLAQQKILSGLIFDNSTFDLRGKDGSIELYKSAKNAWEVGTKIWRELESGKSRAAAEKSENRSDSCPGSISLSGSDFVARGRVMVLPCGLTLGSHVTVVAKPLAARPEFEPKISLVKDDDEPVMVSQFIMELQGLKTVDGEEPPRILHFNPRLKGDWSGKPVIELNTCYRMQWGSALRCDGWRSKADEETGKIISIIVID